MMATYEQILPRREELAARFQPWIDEEISKLENMTSYQGYNEDLPRVSGFQNLLKSYPPKQVINQPQDELIQKLMEV